MYETTFHKYQNNQYICFMEYSIVFNLLYMHSETKMTITHSIISNLPYAHSSMTSAFGDSKKG